MALRDEEGFYYLIDRKTNMSISGGENVYPSEVENLLGAHPKVKGVAVIGRPETKWGEAVHAVIVLRDDATATEREILKRCVDRIAGQAAAIGIVPARDGFAEDRHGKDPAPRPARPAFAAGVNWPLCGQFHWLVWWSIAP
jgi:acyl-CoA synthetase (AMP-forming)/AMP-acid ligase II